jgi:hypothetical protein
MDRIPTDPREAARFGQLLEDAIAQKNYVDENWRYSLATSMLMKKPNWLNAGRRSRESS